MPLPPTDPKNPGEFGPNWRWMLLVMLVAATAFAMFNARTASRHASAKLQKANAWKAESFANNAVAGVMAKSADGYNLALTFARDAPKPVKRGELPENGSAVLEPKRGEEASLGNAKVGIAMISGIHLNEYEYQAPDADNLATGETPALAFKTPIRLAEGSVANSTTIFLAAERPEFFEWVEVEVIDLQGIPLRPTKQRQWRGQSLAMSFQGIAPGDIEAIQIKVKKNAGTTSPATP